jgi:hypothetical protein
MLTAMTIENANRMNTETMLFKIDIFLPSVLELGLRFPSLRWNTQIAPENPTA